MRLIPDQDAQDLATMCRSVFSADCPTTLARALHSSDGDRITAELWKSLAEAGVLGLPIEERFGGSGGTLADLGVCYVEAGRALCPLVFHTTTLAALAIEWLGGPAARESWLPALASGRVRGTTALCNPRDAADLAPRLRARADGNGRWILTGRLDFTADADLADLIVVSADTGSAVLGFVIDTADLHVEPLAMMGGHRAFTVEFDELLVNDHLRILGQLADPDLRRVANAAVALFCLDLVGVAEAVLQRTVDHTRMREQFGRPIASFQAAQHLVADMHIALASARLAAHSAVFWIGRGHTATRETAIAKMHACRVKQITLDAHQLHGGMGYVVDTDLHLFSERARVLATLGGGADDAARWLDGEMNWEERG
ncbi:acyl-CoA dehydrogenase family protein [Mycobacterium vicinigordonae]|uniref:Acyl-CoA/acyl-ACP dehydrogenase n=1 Tax=Mycobacterium vicinigordonae TaxID=1719132 RepID=A0A7D6DZ53_9MYCO|nr:acyl-CoA dehydrogenase family protein [Mycobacterium vicinigordonae]QLL08264.1 acyl-CoA/acyl-ACP dehydrogenase [Mycobacterium vicinigordonae]